MNTDRFLEQCRSKAQEHKERLHRAIADLSDEALNTKTPQGEWSPYQVIEHLNLANGPYLRAMANVIFELPTGQNPEIKHTWFGNMLIKAVGPDSNAKPPKGMVPIKPMFGREVVDRWDENDEAFIALAEGAKGRNLMKGKFSNPTFPIFKLNVADGFKVISDHNERHIRQIEQRCGALRARGRT